MRSDVMQGAGLEIFAEVGLIFFILGFLFVIARLLLMKKEEADAHGQIPLDDGQEVSQ